MQFKLKMGVRDRLHILLRTRKTEEVYGSPPLNTTQQ
jgi:hypothetical protein